MVYFLLFYVFNDMFLPPLLLGPLESESTKGGSTTISLSSIGKEIFTGNLVLFS